MLSYDGVSSLFIKPLVLGEVEYEIFYRLKFYPQIMTTIKHLKVTAKAAVVPLTLPHFLVPPELTYKLNYDESRALEFKVVDDLNREFEVTVLAPEWIVYSISDGLIFF